MSPQISDNVLYHLAAQTRFQAESWIRSNLDQRSKAVDVIKTVDVCSYIVTFLIS